jgi:predicted GH43/DUF377 family glycosyl hydrolase
MAQPAPVHVNRLNGGAPIIRPAANDWENGVTFNAAVIHLTQSNESVAMSGTLQGLADLVGPLPQEIAAVLYRGRPRHDPGYPMTRSRIGLALFDSEMQLLHRFGEPLLSPEPQTTAPDFLGVEDPRITCIDGKFVMIYCGCGIDGDTWRASLCAAESCDLLHWQKTGPIDLGLSDVNNKDGALFPDRLDGWYYLLHRPMIGPMSDWSIHLARRRSLEDRWEDLGPILRANPEVGWAHTWVGAGAVPLPLGGGRYLEIYHSGHLAADGARMYTLGAAVLDLSRANTAVPARVLESRLDHFMVPQTPWEIQGPYPDSVGNVIFTCGAYERDGNIRIIYGGGDTYVMAADVAKAELLRALS